MLALLSQHFLAILVGLAVLVLICLQAWQYHQRALNRLKNSYEKVLNNMLDGFVLQKSDGAIIGFNAAAHHILGLTEDELVGRRSIDPSWNTVRADGTPFPGAEHPAMVTLATGHILQNVIMGVHAPDGGRRWISVNSVPLFDKDEANPSHVVCTFQDITESRRLADEVKQAKVRMELAVAAARIGVWEWNMVSNQVYWDEQLYSIFGQNRETYENTFENWTKCVHPDDRERAVAELDTAVRNHQEYDTIFRVLWPSGVIRHVRALGRIFPGSPTDPARMMGVNWDATEQVEREDKLQEAKEKAEQASRAKSDFLANMSHEIRTPLNGIFGMLALLKDSDLSQTQLDMLHTVESCSEGLLTVLNDILDFSRIESRRLQVELAPFDAHQAAQEVIKLLVAQANHKNLPLEFEFAADLPRIVVGDGARFKQVLLNLVSNAIKFTDKGSITLRVSGKAIAFQKYHYMIEVKDTGIGISRENQQKLFQAFSQADSSISRRFGGTGLGLAISASLAELMGGKLEMESELGKGSVFRLQLPLTTADVTPLLQTTREPEPIKAADTQWRILVVEDNKINQIVVTSLLAKMGFATVDVAEDGLMALQQLELKSYDLIFMDMQMPGMDGLTATRRIREKVKHRPLMIVAMTANAFEEDRRKCLEAGMNEFLVKPFNKKDLERILRLMSERKAS